MRTLGFDIGTGVLRFDRSATFYNVMIVSPIAFLVGNDGGRTKRGRIRIAPPPTQMQMTHGRDLRQGCRGLGEQPSCIILEDYSRRIVFVNRDEYS